MVCINQINHTQHEEAWLNISYRLDIWVSLVINNVFIAVTW